MQLVLQPALCLLLMSSMGNIIPPCLNAAATRYENVLTGEWNMRNLWFKTDQVAMYAANFGSMRLYAKLKKKGSYLGVGVRLRDNWRIWQYYDGDLIFFMFSVGDSASDLFIESPSVRVFLGDRLPPPTAKNNGFPVSTRDPRLFVVESAIKLSYSGYVLKHVASARYLSSRRSWSGTTRIILTYRKPDCLVWRFQS